ncbi:MAG: PBP1A family penicillin-binding protein [Deltaproteobacteria bacterium]|nr:PBP1A family penicillin-binding protein [Deltaproteobacteria bacterium]
MGLKRYFRGGILLAAVAVFLLLRAGWLYYKVGIAMSGGAWEVPSILYGRPTRIHPGDSLANLRLSERLSRLSYRKVAGKPHDPGTWSEGEGRIRIHIRNFRYGEQEERKFPVEIEVKDGRIAAMATTAGAPLEEVVIDPEEVGRILGPGRESRRPVSLDAIPKRLQDAVLAAEDSRFHSHAGIDAIGVARAVFANLRHMRYAQGGSTITQQLAKNFFLTPKKSLWRKLREAELALLIELRYSKKEILAAYLNQIYLGQEGPQGVYGVEEAARHYFSKGVDRLSLEEAALLAGIIRSPNRYSPLRMPAAAKERRNWVLSRMSKLGMIREEEYRDAARSPVRTNVRRAPARGAEYFADYIQKFAEDSLGDGKVYRAGFRIYTTLDPFHQAAAEAAVSRGLADIDQRKGKAGEPLQAALVAIDPATGELTAMVGGRGYGDTQFNRAADAIRQPGSAFKPFVLLAAMDQAAREKGKITLATSVSGEPVSIPTPEGAWTPANFEGKRYGTITVRRMIENSVNTATVRLATQIGLKEIVSTARDAGIESPLSPVPSLALGSFEVTPVELAYAYATIASGGMRYNPFPLDSIIGAKEETVYLGKSGVKQAVDQRAAYLVSYALEGVIDRGTGKPARSAGIGFPASGKTGTTDKNRDSWFVGYTPEVVCAVWVGRDSGGDTGVTGAEGALRIWSRFMKSIYSSAGPRALQPPQGIVTAEIDPASGFLATSACPERFTEAFIEGTVPKETCPLHQVHPLVESVRKGLRGIGDFFRNLFK